MGAFDWDRNRIDNLRRRDLRLNFKTDGERYRKPAPKLICENCGDRAYKIENGKRLCSQC